jgi:integrase
VVLAGETTSGWRLDQVMPARRAGLELPGATVWRRCRSSPVVLTEAAAVALRRERAAQAAERMRAGAAWQNRSRVGGSLNPSNLRLRSFQPMLKRAGLPMMRFHDLRHSAATLLLGVGVHPKIVSEVLGHTRVSITLDVYSHVTATMQHQAVSALDDLLAVSQDGETQNRS